MRINFTTQKEAKAAADAAHQYLIDTDSEYAKSVADGHTLCWDTPEKCEDGWSLSIDDRVEAAFNITAVPR